MTLSECLEQLEALAVEAEKSPDTDLIAMILWTTVGATYGGLLRPFAQYVARFLAETQRAGDVREN